MESARLRRTFDEGVDIAIISVKESTHLRRTFGEGASIAIISTRGKEEVSVVHTAKDLPSSPPV